MHVCVLSISWLPGQSHSWHLLFKEIQHSTTYFHSTIMSQIHSCHASTCNAVNHCPWVVTQQSKGYYHRRRSGWTSGGTHGERRRWVRAEWDWVWEECPLSSLLRGLGERRELPQRGPGQILAYFEGHRTLIFVPIWQNPGGQFALASPAPNSGGTCPPVPPWYTPMAITLH